MRKKKRGHFKWDESALAVLPELRTGQLKQIGRKCSEIAGTVEGIDAGQGSGAGTVSFVVGRHGFVMICDYEDDIWVLYHVRTLPPLKGKRKASDSGGDDNWSMLPRAKLAQMLCRSVADYFLYKVRRFAVSICRMTASPSAFRQRLALESSESRLLRESRRPAWEEILTPAVARVREIERALARHGDWWLQALSETDQCTLVPAPARRATRAHNRTLESERLLL